MNQATAQHLVFAVAAENGVAADAVFVTLTSEGGNTVYVHPRRTPRDEVKQHFNHPEMPDIGYSAMIDVSSLNGHYSLGLARTYQGNFGICRQFHIPLQINP